MTIIKIEHGRLSGNGYFLTRPDNLGRLSGLKLMGKIRVHNSVHRPPRSAQLIANMVFRQLFR